MIKSILFFLVIYLPFEEFVLKHLAISELGYNMLKQIPDLLVIFLFFVIFASKVLTNSKFTPPHDKVLYVLFFLLCLTTVSALYNNASIFNSLLNFKASIRYMLLMFIVYESSFALSDIRRILNLIFFMGIIQGFIGILSYFLGDSAIHFFSPGGYSDYGGVKYNSFNEAKGSIFGTMNFPAVFGYFMLLVLTLLLSFKSFLLKNAFTFYFFVLFFLVNVFLSGSRAATILAILSFTFFTFKSRYGFIKITLIALSGSLFFIFFVEGFEISSDYKDFSYIFYGNLIEMLEHQRLGMGYLFLDNFSKINMLLGLSFDKEFVIDTIIANFVIPSTLKDHVIYFIEDIYWLSLYLYSGITGIVLYFIIFYSVYRETIIKHKDLISNKFILFIKFNLFVILVASLLNQILEFRQYSFYFWLIVGLYFRYMRIQTMLKK